MSRAASDIADGRFLAERADQLGEQAASSPPISRAYRRATAS